MIKLIKNKVIVCFLILILSCFGLILFSGCVQGKPVKSAEGSKSSIVSNNYDYPKIASWLSKKEELISSNKPFDLIMTGWVTSEEADKFKANNPDVAYWREFEKGIVVSSPNSDTAINFDKEYTDISTNKKSASFIVGKGDGRIFNE